MIKTIDVVYKTIHKRWKKRSGFLWLRITEFEVKVEQIQIEGHDKLAMSRVWISIDNINKFEGYFGKPQPFGTIYLFNEILRELRHPNTIPEELHHIFKVFYKKCKYS
ncbi:MAG: hypothetical protein M3Q80_03080 [bacterium]|nr:hypothetical protein [bacterium]